MTGKSEKCINCGRCLQVCPLFRAHGHEELSPRAKSVVFSMLDADQGGLNQKRAFRLAEMCLSCGRCAKACTQGVDVASMVGRVRRDMKDGKNHLWNMVLSKQPKLTPARVKLLAVAEKLPLKTVHELVDQAKALAKEPMAPFVRAVKRAEPEQKRRVMLFPGCTANNYRPFLTDTALSLLNLAGHEILGQSKACCGFPLASAGLGAAAGKNTGQVLDDWRGLDRPEVAVFCASCGHGLMNIPKSAFRDDLEYEQWRQAVVPLSEFLDNIDFEPSDQTGAIHYHVPCHDASDSDEKLMRRIFRDRLHVHKDNCCGFGGVFRLKSPDKAAKVSRAAWTAMAPAPGDHVLTGCSACALRLSIDAPQGVVAGHWLEGLRPLQMEAGTSDIADKKRKP